MDMEWRVAGESDKNTNDDSFYQTVWMQEHLCDYDAIQIADKRIGQDDNDLSVGQEQLLKFNETVGQIEPSQGEGFEYISIGQVLDLLNDSFGRNSYQFIELSRRVDTINRSDYHFVVRVMLLIPSLGLYIIREGLESFSNKAFKQGFRGNSVAGADLASLLDVTPEGALSLWKNAEADAKKRCLVDMGVGSQFLVDPAENKKHGRKAAKASKEAPPEAEGETVVQSEDEVVRRSKSMTELKVLMKEKGMKSPALYPIASRVLEKEVSKWADLSADDMIAVITHMRENNGESE